MHKKTVNFLYRILNSRALKIAKRPNDDSALKFAFFFVLWNVLFPSVFSAKV